MIAIHIKQVIIHPYPNGNKSILSKAAENLFLSTKKTLGQRIRFKLIYLFKNACKVVVIVKHPFTKVCL